VSGLLTPARTPAILVTPGKEPYEKIALITFTLILVLGLTVSLVWAGSSALHAIPWQVLAGGGQPVASSNGLTLNGMLGQPIIGQAAGSTTTLQGGF
jgi:hypothetical protein